VNVRHIADDQGRSNDGAAATRSGIAAVRRHPSLWWPALCAAARFAPRGWWRRAPFLPVPDDRYWRFRMETAYGDESAQVDADDMGEVLRWSHRARARRR